MKIEVTTITPEVAAIMLQNNPVNRNLRKRYVNSLARDMMSGAWQVNGDAIRLNCDGSLIDGQHRLSACILAGVPFKTVVISGLQNDVRQTIDGGIKRTHGDRLSMAGVANANHVSAVGRFIGSVAFGMLNANFTNHELTVIIDRAPSIHRSVNVGTNAFPGMGKLLSGIHCIGHELGQSEDADAFISVFKTGLPTYPGDAAHVLRERIVMHQGKLTAYGREDLIRATIQAWRNFSSKTPTKIIKASDDVRIKGWTPERIGLQ